MSTLTIERPPRLPSSPIPSSTRSFPLSPLNPFRYNDFDHEPDDSTATAITTTITAISNANHSSPCRASRMSSPPIRTGNAFFPPPLGSSSPPLPSPTPTPTNPSYLHPPSSPLQPSSAGTGTSIYSFSQPNRTLSFASRARARQPPSASTNVPDPHARWGPRPLMGRHSQSVAHYTSFGESVDGMTEKSVKGTMWRDKLRQQCLSLSSGGASGGRGDGTGPPSLARNSKRGGQGNLYLPKGLTAQARAKSRREPVRMFDPAGDDEDMEVGTDEEEAESDEIFRRMMQKQKRQLAHQAKVQYEREVGGSDPAVLEMDIRAAEEDDQPPPRLEQTTAHTQFTSPLANNNANNVPGTIWRRYRQENTLPTPGITMSTPATGTYAGSNLDSSAIRPSNSLHPLEYDDPEVELDETELARLAQMEEEERAMIEQFGNGFSRAGMAAENQEGDVFLDGLTWEDLEPDEDELESARQGDVEMS